MTTGVGGAGDVEGLASVEVGALVLAAPSLDRPFRAGESVPVSAGNGLHFHVLAARSDSAYLRLSGVDLHDGHNPRVADPPSARDIERRPRARPVREPGPFRP